MTRVLVVVPPLLGHITPLVGVGHLLQAAGHDVAWIGGAAQVGALDPTAVRLPPLATPLGAAEVTRPPGLRGFAALKFLWESVLVPLADRMVAAVDDAVTTWAPDVLLVDQQALAGALVAQRRGLPWITSASTSAELTDPLAGMPKVAAWLAGLQDGLRGRHGVTAPDDLRFSPHLVLVFSTPELVGPVTVPGAPPVRFVGPAPATHPDDRFDPPISDRPLVVITLGTSNADAGARFLGEAVTALTSPPLADRVDAVVLDPTVTEPSRPRPGLLVLPSAPLPALFRHAAAVVCHGGHNTVCEALAEGVPLVVAPIRDDQPIVAGQVVGAGAGVRLRFDRARAEDIAEALGAVLDDPRHRLGAERIAHSFRTAGGARAAARFVTALSPAAVTSG